MPRVYRNDARPTVSARPPQRDWPTAAPPQQSSKRGSAGRQTARRNVSGDELPAVSVPLPLVRSNDGGRNGPLLITL